MHVTDAVNSTRPDQISRNTLSQSHVLLCAESGEDGLTWMYVTPRHTATSSNIPLILANVQGAQKAASKVPLHRAGPLPIHSGLTGVSL